MSFETLTEPYTLSGPGCILFFTGLRIKITVVSIIELFRCFRLLCAVERAAATALFDARRVELAAHDGVAESDVLHAATADQNDRVFLQVVSFAGNVRGDFHAVRKANARDLSDSGVRLTRGLRGDARACPAFKWSGIERRTI